MEQRAAADSAICPGFGMPTRGTAPSDAEMTPATPVAETPGTMTLGGPTWPRANLPRVAKPSIGYPLAVRSLRSGFSGCGARGPPSVGRRSPLCKAVHRRSCSATNSCDHRRFTLPWNRPRSPAAPRILGGLCGNGPSSASPLALTRRRMLSALRCARQCDDSDWEAYFNPRQRRHRRLLTP